jgi:dTDP-4-dehydrorhamnose reductase
MGTINADVLYSYGNVTAYSDERLKKDWETLPTNFVEELAKIKSGTYTRIDSGERQLGVGAQSLQAILKEAVSEKEEYLGVHYGNTAMVSAVELAKEVVKLKELSTKQQKQIEDQNKRIVFLETK